MTLYVDHLAVASEFRAYLNPVKMEELSIEDGDLVQITTRSKFKFPITVLASSSVQSDRIAMSRPLRVNYGLYLGDVVKIDHMAKLKPAESVVFAPVSETVETIDGPVADVLVQSKINFRGMVVRPGFVVPVFALNHVFEFRVVSVAPEEVVVVRNPGVVECRNSKVPRDNGPRFDGVCYDDIGGLKIGMIRQAIELKESTTFMVTGPAGCGKTLLASAIRNETNSYFVYMRGMQLFTMDEDVVIQKLDELAETVIENAPSILFFDDFDVAANEQVGEDGTVDDRLSSALFGMLQKLKKVEKVIVVCTMREKVPKKFYLQTCHINIGLPNYEERLSILRAITRKGTLASEGILEKIAKVSEKRTGSELKRIVERDYFNVMLDISEDVGRKVNVSQLGMFVVKNNPEEKPSKDEADVSAQKDLLKFGPDDRMMHHTNEEEEEEEEQRRSRRSRHRRRHGRSHRHRRHSRKRARRDYSSDSEDSSEEDEDEQRSRRSRSRRRSAKKRRDYSSDSEEESDDEFKGVYGKGKTRNRKPASKSRKARQESSEDSDESDSGRERVSKSRTRGEADQRAKARRREETSSDSEGVEDVRRRTTFPDESDSDEKQGSKRVSKAWGNDRRKTKNRQDSDDSDDDVAKPRAKKPQLRDDSEDEIKVRKAKKQASDDSDEENMKVARKRRSGDDSDGDKGGRKRKQPQASDESDEEDTTTRKTKKAKARSSDDEEINQTKSKAPTRKMQEKQTQKPPVRRQPEPRDVSDDSDESSSEETSSLYGHKKKPNTRPAQKAAFSDPFGNNVERAGNFPSRKAAAKPAAKDKQLPQRKVAQDSKKKTSGNPFALPTSAKKKPKLCVESDYDDEEAPQDAGPQSDYSASGDDGDIRVSEF